MEKPAQPTLTLTHKDWEFVSHGDMCEWVTDLLNGLDLGHEKKVSQQEDLQSAQGAKKASVGARSTATRFQHVVNYVRTSRSNSTDTTISERTRRDSKAVQHRIAALEKQNKALERKLDEVLNLLRSSK